MYNPLNEYVTQINKIENQPRQDSVEAYKDLTKAINEYPEIIVERASWILNGSYGEGPYTKAHAVIKSKMNKPAWFFMTVAALEWMTPRYYASKAYTKSSQDKKDYLNSELEKMINEYLEEMEE